MFKTALLAALGLAWASGTANAATWVFSNLDADKNLELVAREFRPLDRHIFQAWDNNRDDRLGTREFYGNLYRWWDVNGDGQLDENEYARGWQAWGRGFSAPDFATLDPNSDGIISQREFGAGVANSGYFDVWDNNRDGWLAWNEFEPGLFEIWDRDGNSVINSAEFAAWRQPMARLANPIEPGFDPVDTAAEPTGRLATNANPAVPTGQCRGLIASANPIEPGFDPIDTAAEPIGDLMTGTNRVEPGFDPIDTAAEPNVRLPLLTRPVSLVRIDEQQVYNSRGEELGEVESVRCGPDGQLYAVVNFGEGFLSIGGTPRIVPLSRMFLANDRMVLPGISEVEAATFPLAAGNDPDEGLLNRGYYDVGPDYSVPMRYTERTLPNLR